MTFAEWFNNSIHPPLCEGRVIEGVLLGLDARIMLKKESEFLIMVKCTSWEKFAPPYSLGYYQNLPIGPMKHPGIAVILAKPKLLSIHFP